MLPQGIHYAAVFLSDSSRDRVLQHAPPLHETVSADHMTLAYRPLLDLCLELPLGREAPLFVEGLACDYRVQVRCAARFFAACSAAFKLAGLHPLLQLAALWCVWEACAVAVQFYVGPSALLKGLCWLSG